MKARSSIRWIVLAILACAGLYLVGNSRVALWDRDEPWYAQCTLKMIQSGDYAVPRYLDGSLRAEKPPMVYWLQSVPMRLMADREFAPRLVASVAMILALIILAAGVWRVAGPRRAAWTVFIFGTCALTIAAGKMCLTDAVLMCSVIPMQFALLDFYRGRGGHWHVILIAACVGLGGLTKGPIIFVPPLMTLVMLAIIDHQRWRQFVREQPAEARQRVAYGLGAFAAVLGAAVLIVGPWLYLNYTREPQWLIAVFQTAKAHLAEVQDQHTGGFGYYFLLLWATYFPWSLLVPIAAIVAWKNRHLPVLRFAIAAIVGPWLFQECMKTKLPHYMLGTYPFLALLTADAIVRCLRGQRQSLQRPLFRWATLLWALVVGGIPSLVWLLARPELGFENLPYAAMLAVSAFGFIYTLGVWLLFQLRKTAWALGWIGAGFLILVGMAYAWMIPSSPFLDISRRICVVLEREGALAGPQQSRRVASVVYPSVPKDVPQWVEPSLDYYQGGTLQKIREDAYLSLNPPEDWPEVMVMSPKIWDFSGGEVQKHLEIVGNVRGLAYEGGLRPVEVWVVRKRARATALPVSMP